MKKLMIVTLVVAMFLVAACQTAPSEGDDSLTGRIVLTDDDFVFIDDNETDSSSPSDDDDTSVVDEPGDVEQAPPSVDERDVAYVRRVVEGELVVVTLQAVDPDGDAITYTYGAPLNAQGRWQTQIGDEGRYLTSITASDGRLSTSEDLLIIVERANRPPVVECPSRVTVSEGEEVVINCNIYDEEGDDIITSYEGWMSGPRKVTGYDDAGEYTVLVRASDGQSESTATVTIIVRDVNRPPVIDSLNDVSVMETQIVRVVPRVQDPDGDVVTISFSEPLGDDGVWSTQKGDAGTYIVSVVASDGVATVSEEFTITVTQLNTAPVVRDIGNIEVNEGETIRIPVHAYDPEGDELIIIYSGFMTEQEYQTTYGDAGVYEQSVTVSDGVLETTKRFTITVNFVNRPPVFVIPE